MTVSFIMRLSFQIFPHKRNIDSVLPYRFMCGNLPCVKKADPAHWFFYYNIPEKKKKKFLFILYAKDKIDGQKATFWAIHIKIDQKITKNRSENAMLWLKTHKKWVILLGKLSIKRKYSIAVVYIQTAHDGFL